MPEARKPMLSAAELEFVKGNGFQPHPESVPVSSEPAPEVKGKAQRMEMPRKPEKEGSVRFTVDMRVSQHKELKKAALDADVPMTELVRFILTNWLIELKESQEG